MEYRTIQIHLVVRLLGVSIVVCTKLNRNWVKFNFPDLFAQGYWEQM